VEVETYGHTKLEWLKSFLELPNGIPSHDTFGWVFAQLDTDAFGQCFSIWVETLRERLPGQVVAIDGKTLRRSHDRQNNREALHRVSAWAEGNRLVLGQLEVDGKSNEITAIPKLLRRLDIRDCIVTIDAMGCQREIAAQIKKQGGDYALALKDNQPRLAQRVETLFAHAASDRGRHLRQSRHTTIGKDHGRREQRVCRVLTTDDWSVFLDPEDRWEGLRSVIRIEATRQIGDVISTSVRYYISSLT
jgi:predicted transposase YbfD/YdcC